MKKSCATPPSPRLRRAGRAPEPRSILPEMIRRRFQCCLAVAAFVIGVAASVPSAQSSSSLPDIDAYVARVLAEFEIPGLSVAVVKDGKVVLAKGYGVRKLGAREAVDARTLFGIASNTKVMTATAL